MMRKSSNPPTDLLNSQKENGGLPADAALDTPVTPPLPATSPLGADPILVAWETLLRENPAAPALLDVHGHLLLRRADLDRLARRIEPAFCGLAPGSILLFPSENRAEWPAVFLAALRRQLAFMPVEATSHLADDADWLQTMGVRAIARPDSGSIRVERLHHPPVAWTDSAPTLLKVTSGTTGTPRAVRFRSAALWHDANQILTGMGIQPHERQLAVVSFAHSYGFSSLVLPLLIAGTPLVLTPNPLPALLATACREGGATVFPGVPVMFRALAQSDSIPSLAPLRLCISAGAPLSPEITNRFKARFNLPIQVFYGASECGGITFDSRPASGTEPGVVGTPLPAIDLSLDHPPGPSRVTICGPTLGDGYHPAEAEDDGTLDGTRFRPGDLLEYRTEGWVLAGRTDDLLNIAGRKASPLEIERALSQTALVDETVVFGMPRPDGHHWIIAAVVGAQVDDAALRAACAKRIPTWMIPDRIWHLPAIPTNARGKVSRKALAEIYPEKITAGRAVSSVMLE